MLRKELYTHSLALVLAVLLCLVCASALAGQTLTGVGDVASAQDMDVNGADWTVYNPQDSLKTATGQVGEYASGMWAGEVGYHLDRLEIGDELVVIIETEQTGEDGPKGYYAVMNHTLTNADPAIFDAMELRQVPVPRMENLGPGGLQLAWDAALEDSATENIAGYNVFRSSDNETFTKVNTHLVTDTQYTDSGFAPEHPFYAIGLAYRGTPNLDGSVLSGSVQVELVTYALTVTNGSGSGEYEEGAVVNIQADAPAEGKVFDKWTGDTSHLADAESSSTTVTMPASSVSVTATYKDLPPATYALTVRSSGASGAAITATPSTYGGTTNYIKADINPGTQITLTAPADSGEAIFNSWTGCDSTNQSARTCSVTMNTNKTVTVRYDGDRPAVLPGVLMLLLDDE